METAEYASLSESDAAWKSIINNAASDVVWSMLNKFSPISRSNTIKCRIFNNYSL